MRPIGPITDRLLSSGRGAWGGLNMHEPPADLLHRLRKHHQEHVLFGWEKLQPAERDALVNQLAGINLEEIRALYEKRDRAQALPSKERISPVPMIAHNELTDADRQTGEQVLALGQVAVLLVAGGQGTRLGFDKPKGMFRIGPVSNKSLFQIHAEKVFALSRRYERPVPFLVMTSPATHADTVDFFEQNGYFRLPKSDVRFFQQGTMPAVDLNTGKLLLEKPGVLFTSPNGHGGTLTALAESGLLDELIGRGIRSIFYFQVDNPLVKVAHPAFIGRHHSINSEVSSKAIVKAYPKEKMGVFALIDQHCGIIEYSDMPEDLVNAVDAEGKLLHRAGSPAIHIFDVEFLVRITRGAQRLPYHVARKKVPCIDAEGRPINPTRENALKFELFVFDALPLADRWLVVEALRSEEFSPVKNADGADSPATARRDLINLAAKWLQAANVEVPRDEKGDVAVPIEISPLFALDERELVARISAARTMDGPLYLE
jgi:UDP-N-acetylglucosamine/UDP-N-acetylgalactosamine diphosphorylase